MKDYWSKTKKRERRRAFPRQLRWHVLYSVILNQYAEEDLETSKAHE